MKREAEDRQGGYQQHKKQKHDGYEQRQRYDEQRNNYRRDELSHGRYDNGAGRNNHQSASNQQRLSYPDTLAKLPPATSPSAEVPAYAPFLVSAALPPLPPILEGPLASAPFKHKSLVTYNRTTSTNDISYERLEFLGDAYIELIASRLLFERYFNLPSGHQSQLRELLVKNETLAEYTRAYGLEKRIEMAAFERMNEDTLGSGKGSSSKANKALIKVLGDVFEAYVAAVILSDLEHGFATAEKWLTALWAPKLLEVGDTFRASAPVTDTSADPLATYNPSAKAEMQKRILGPKGVKLDYEIYQKSVELKGAQLGQNKHFIALYLTGYGYERQLLGKGEGRNKVEAGNCAAQQAMFGENKGIVEECEKVNLAGREKRKLEREKEAAESAVAKAT